MARRVFLRYGRESFNPETCAGPNAAWMAVERLQARGARARIWRSLENGAPAWHVYVHRDDVQALREADIADRHRPLMRDKPSERHGSMVEETKTEAKTPTRAELETSIKKAASENRMSDLLALTDQLKGIDIAERKAAAEKRAQAAAGVNRTILEAVKPVLAKFENEIVSVGGVCRITYNVSEKLIDVSCGEKAARAAPKSANGGAGKTSEQYGVSLGSIFDTHATAEEKAAHDAEPDNTRRWNLKKKVRARAEADGLIQKIA